MKNFTDVQLRRLQFHLSDPYQQAGLVDRIPEGAELVQVLNVYEFDRYPKEKIRCAECGSRLHKHGFTAELSDGSLVLLGSACGEKLFGESWIKAEKRLSDHRSRQGYLWTVDELQRNMPLIRECLTDWRFVIDRLEGSHGRFRNAMPVLHEKLKHAARYDEGYLEFFQSGRGQSRVMMRGAGYFKDVDGNAVLNRTREWLNDCEQAANDTDLFTLKDMKKLSKAGQEISRDLEEIHGACADAIRFFEINNLQLIAGWATQSEVIPGIYSANQSKIVWHETGAEMTLPLNFHVPNQNLLQLTRPTRFPKSKAA